MVRALTSCLITLQLVSVALGQGVFVATNQSVANRASGGLPPDISATVGPTQVGVMLNGKIEIFDKSLAAGLGSLGLNQFFAPATPVGRVFDPRIHFDPTSRRWFTLAVDNGRAANGFLIGVSRGSKLNTFFPPSGDWDWFRVDSDSTDQRWADFPTLGVSRGTVTVSANMLPIDDSAGLTRETTLLVLPKADLLNPPPTVSGAHLLDGEIGVVGNTAQPVQDRTIYDGALAPRLLAFDRNDLTVFGNSHFRFSRLNNAPAAPTTELLADVPMTLRGIPQNSRQPDGVQALATDDGRISGAVIRVDGQGIWGTQAVRSNDRNAIRWFQLNAATGAVLQEGLITHATQDLFQPSIGVSQSGQVVIGYGGSGPNEGEFPSGYAVVGTTTAGVTTFGDPIVVAQGSSTYLQLDQFNRNRWGDYTSTVCDPADPNIFWTIQQAATAADDYSVHAAEIIAYPAGEVYWRNAGDGAFNTGAEWIGDTVPGAADRAVFSRYDQASFAITFPAGTTATRGASVHQGSVEWDLAGNVYDVTSQPNVSLYVGFHLSDCRLTIRGGPGSEFRSSFDLITGGHPGGVATVTLGGDSAATWRCGAIFVGADDFFTNEPISTGTLIIGAGGTLRGGVTSGEVIVARGSTMILAGGEIDLGEINLRGTLVHTPAVVQTINPNLVATGTVEVRSATARLNLTGRLSSPPLATLFKTGPGELRLAGDSTAAQQGQILVNAGRLTITGRVAGSIFLEPNTVLGGTGESTGDVEFRSLAHLQPGLSVGTLRFNELGIAVDALLDFELSLPNVIGGTVNDLVIVAGDFSPSGILNVTALPGFGPGLYTLFDYAGDHFGELPRLGNMPPGFTYLIIDDLDDTRIHLRVVPEPSTSLLMVLLAGRLLGKRKHRAGASRD